MKMREQRLMEVSTKLKAAVERHETDKEKCYTLHGFHLALIKLRKVEFSPLDLDQLETYVDYMLERYEIGEGLMPDAKAVENA